MHVKRDIRPIVGTLEPDSVLTPAGFPLWHYRGSFVRTKDGDTAVIRLDLGFGVFQQIPVRIVGYNAPELHGPHAAEAQKAKAQLELYLTDTTLYLVTEKDRQSFERYLARVFIASKEGGPLVDIASIMAPFNVPQGQ